MSHRVFTVPPEARATRLDRFLSGQMPGISRERVKKAVREGGCLLDDRPCPDPSTRLSPGQHIALRLEEEQSPLLPEAGELRLLYSDAHLAVLDKPAGLIVHPCPSCKESTLVHRLLAHFPRLARMEGLRPGIVHRLDKDTSGLMIVALEEEARLALVRAFARREVHKEYLAIARGAPDPRQGEIVLSLGRHPTRKTRMAAVPENRGGKAARSSYETLYADPGGRFALLKVRILTGRTHQVRAHLAHIGHPLWGDALYGPAGGDGPCARHMLHAHRLAFSHPSSGERLALRSPPPQDFLRAALDLSRRMQRIVLVGAPGSGKSALLRALEKIGSLPCFSADAAVHALYRPGEDGHYRIRQRFGEGCAPDGAPVDRAALFAALRENPRLFRDLEEMIHPLVQHRLEAFWAEAEHAGSSRAVAEIPLYLENGGKRCSAYAGGLGPARARGDTGGSALRVDKHAGEPGPARARGDTGGSAPRVDKHGDRLDPMPLIVGVACDENARAARLDASRKLTQEALAVLDGRQWPQQRKLAACDIVIDNSASPERLEEEARKLLERLDDLRAREEDELAARLASLWA